MALKTHGTMAVDWEQRIDFDRLRRERLARIKELLAKSELGAVLCFDMNNVRYITSTHIGTWAQDKISRFTLLPQGDEPILWDFGSAARHHQLNCPWLGDRSRAGIPMMRGAMTPEMGRAEDVAKKIRVELDKRGLLKEPLGVDIESDERRQVHCGEPQPRPTNGILVAMMFRNSALASGGRVAMKTIASATFCTSMRGSGTVCPFGCSWPDEERSVIGVSALPTSTWPQAMS